MIDPNTEHLVSLTRACRLFPRRRQGKKPHVSCLYRWTTSGCRGVLLESVQVGATRCTSREAITRFIKRLSHTAIPACPSVGAGPEEAASETDQQLDAERF